MYKNGLGPSPNLGHAILDAGVYTKAGIARLIVWRELQIGDLRHWPSPLVRDVVDDENAARVHHLAIVSVVRLSSNPIFSGYNFCF